MAEKHYPQLAAYGKALRAAGMSEPEIRRAVNILEASLERDEAAALSKTVEDNTNDEQDLTPRERAIRAAGREIDRASTGQPQGLVKGEQQDLHRDLSQHDIDAINFTRAHSGQEPLTFEEIQREVLRRARPLGPDDAPLPPEIASKKLTRYQVAQLNLTRATTGEPELIYWKDAPDEKA